MDSFRKVAHLAPIRFSAAMNDHLVMVGIPRAAMDSSSGVWPPPVDNCPHTAAKLLSQY